MHSKYKWFDKILWIEKGYRARAVKNIRPDEKFFVDHFPRLPVVPGMLQLEGLAQLGSWLVNASNDFGYAVTSQNIRGVNFRSFVKPGDQLLLEAEISSREPGRVSVTGKVTVDGKVVASAKEIVYSCLLLSPEQQAKIKQGFKEVQVIYQSSGGPDE